ncbi:MAG: hypothetical protein LBR75_04765 [Prevotellaceae bacterium]|nr:hypothetical protein [Prevotellaceae bacterium]
MKKTALSLLIIVQTMFCLAQEMPTAPKFKFYGNVRIDTYYNSRQMEEAAEGFWLSYPKPEALDAFGNDLNGQSMAGMTATASRFGFDFLPFRVDKLNMNLSGKIETDFQGFGGTATVMRIRHAYLNMNFGKSDVLAGQNWHPFYDNCAPQVLDLNGGSPYQPFGRSPQLRYSYTTNDLKIYGAAVYQIQFTSFGPNGRSHVYQRNAKLPELVAGLDYKAGDFKLGAGAEYKQIEPRTTATINIDNVAQTVAVDEKLPSAAVNAYVQYSHNLLTLKAKGTFGQNLSDMQMLGGYAVTDENARGERSYKPFNVVSTWLSADYKFGENSPFALNIFGGYSKNLGTDHAIKGDVYGNVMFNNQMLSETWRGSTNLSYTLTHWRLALEYDFNRAYYGKLKTENGKAENAEGINGNRVLAVLQFFF